jgi:hypothetical protein
MPDAGMHFDTPTPHVELRRWLSLQLVPMLMWRDRWAR